MSTSNLRDSNILQDFTVWIDGVGKIGEAPNFQPPEINIQTEEFRGGGMDGVAEIPMGIEKIEFDFSLHTWDEQIWSKLGYGPGSLDVPITFRGYLLSPNGKEKGVIVNTLSLVKAIKTGKVEAGKKVEMTINLCANYYQHIVDGEEVCEIDVFNKVMFFNGVDKSASARRILGLSS
ncbi:phage major tail tube protein [Bradyrhizobium sp. SZCCHNR3118]|uniref:phage major tail tube protein n=1 Tax=Bradyrhizobium sp. SZCCHNR3118 TaxID=3057468 RepID=UPI00291645E9|nr:phage major tail tube protein [Bradyrhizobium sp. SZCCHNR3118]